MGAIRGRGERFQNLPDFSRGYKTPKVPCQNGLVTTCHCSRRCSHILRPWPKAYLNFWFGWANYVVLGCPDCGGSTTEPRVEYRSIREARVSADRLLGEVEEFMDEDFCTDELTFDGGRLSIAEALQQLVSSPAIVRGCWTRRLHQPFQLWRSALLFLVLVRLAQWTQGMS